MWDPEERSRGAVSSSSKRISEVVFEAGRNRRQPERLWRVHIVSMLTEVVKCDIGAFSSGDFKP